MNCGIKIPSEETPRRTTPEKNPQNTIFLPQPHENDCTNIF